ncbi:MAG: diol dehydratase reactivase subunit alpha [Deltaproteobacteria bacterium]|nr:diol dehydratase reactivase subunit alpha [Deltaproteobacteria bacterium]
MAYIAGVDVGNNTTEVAIGLLTPGQDMRFLSSSLVRTVGMKGTIQNAMGVIHALDEALAPLNLSRKDLGRILLNEATPVIGDVAMETITETVITESAMIGHNPATPGGLGLGLGATIPLEHLDSAVSDRHWIVLVPGTVDFREAASRINQAMADGLAIAGAIVQNDDGVLIVNRLKRPIPIVDEVKLMDRVPVGMLAAVEVAGPGKSVDKLSNTYDIATLFGLDPEETRQVVPVARALMGTRSAVVIKTPRGEIQERRIPAGTLGLVGHKRKTEVRVEEGAEAIMQRVAEVAPLEEIRGEPGTNVGGMIENVRCLVAELTDQPASAIQVRDILAVDTLKPQKVLGGLAGEYTMGNAVGLAAMVETHRLPMQRLATRLEDEISVPVAVGGVEAEMAIRGALTTPGTRAPIAVLDLGGGSTDASFLSESGEMRSIHLAGAGDMVTLLIDTELGLENRELAESIKRHPLAKVETLFNMRHEDGSVQFFDQALEPRFFGRVVALSDEGPIPLETNAPLRRILEVRRRAKRKVFVQNALRALKKVAPAENIRLISFVVMVGGSALDFEIPRMISDALVEYGVVTGKANVRGIEGPRNAVATGLVLKYAEENEM